MTANIVQYVIPRGSSSFAVWPMFLTSRARRKGRNTCASQSRNRRGSAWLRQYKGACVVGRGRNQRGSTNHATITVAFGIIAIIFVGILGFFYLQQVVDTASSGSDIRALESQVVELKERQKELELEGAQIRSLQAVQDHVDKLNLVQTERVTYLAPSPDRIALKEQ